MTSGTQQQMMGQILSIEQRLTSVAAQLDASRKELRRMEELLEKTSREVSDIASGIVSMRSGVESIAAEHDSAEQLRNTLASTVGDAFQAFHKVMSVAQQLGFDSHSPEQFSGQFSHQFSNSVIPEHGFTAVQDATIAVTPPGIIPLGVPPLPTLEDEAIDNADAAQVAFIEQALDSIPSETLDAIPSESFPAQVISSESTLDEIPQENISDVPEAQVEAFAPPVDLASLPSLEEIAALGDLPNFSSGENKEAEEKVEAEVATEIPAAAEEIAVPELPQNLADLPELPELPLPAPSETPVETIQAEEVAVEAVAETSETESEAEIAAAKPAEEKIAETTDESNDEIDPEIAALLGQMTSSVDTEFPPELPA